MTKASFYFVRRVIRGYQVEKGDYVAKLDNNRCYKLKNFDPSDLKNFEVLPTPLDMSTFTYVHVGSSPVCHPDLAKLSKTVNSVA